MIRHIVFFSLKPEADLKAAMARLRRLGDIPGSRSFEVAANLKVDQIANEIDVVVYAEFPDLAALRAYKAHPDYAETTRIVRPMRELRLAADIESEPSER